MRRSDFFSSMERTVTLKQILGKGTTNAQAVFQTMSRALVSFGGATLPAGYEAVPEGTIRVFLRSIPVNIAVGDWIAVSDTRVAEEFAYQITAIDTTVAGANARRYKVRLEARRRTP